ncbi:MAG: response regulator transcription factor [Oscillospiraceae bacterium]|nr:response regulator transcription factor [Oscillospiraceae bacterium]
MAYNVLIVEDQELPRELFEIYVRSDARFCHLLSISSASAALSVCRSNRVDLILMDVMTELGHSGLDAAETIKRAFPEIRIIVVTSMPEYSWLARAREIGVDSFWYKDGHKESLLDVMKRTMAGERIYPDDTPLLSIGRTTNHAFTERELDVLKELTTGDTNAEIAERLGISVATVKSHLLHMMEKTGFRTRTELVSEARALGIVIQTRRAETQRE